MSVRFFCGVAGNRRVGSQFDRINCKEILFSFIREQSVSVREQSVPISGGKTTNKYRGITVLKTLSRRGQ